MKYMIMMFGSQKDLTDIAGAWSSDEVTALHEFMGKWNNDLVESGEFVDAQGLSQPAHARRVSLRDGSLVVTDGPYAETQEVLVGYTTVDCASYDRAIEIAAQLANTPHPEGSDLGRDWYVDIRPCADSFEELEL
ncbi:YciI family protein [Amycolatopsis roodepoortensis]|uniref:YciI family protein n=1 Tax=Amycolatopsis roodepoortensis TaxID=700274 RepID=UPI00214BC123|nr:YciI family protein [Amycolatopsis roodepoortensis]UUV29491.1 YciI family protein [Amycolatopsis roodepoortensis]